MATADAVKGEGQGGTAPTEPRRSTSLFAYAFRRLTPNYEKSEVLGDAFYRGTTLGASAGAVAGPLYVMRWHRKAGLYGRVYRCAEVVAAAIGVATSTSVALAAFKTRGCGAPDLTPRGLESSTRAEIEAFAKSVSLTVVAGGSGGVAVSSAGDGGEKAAGGAAGAGTGAGGDLRRGDAGSASPPASSSNRDALTAGDIRTREAFVNVLLRRNEEANPCGRARDTYMITGAVVGAPPLLGMMIAGYARGTAQKQSGLPAMLNRGFTGLHIAMLSGALVGASLGGTLVSTFLWAGCSLSQTHKKLDAERRTVRSDARASDTSAAAAPDSETRDKSA